MTKSYHIGIDARLFGTKQAAGIGVVVEELVGNLIKIDQHNRYTVMVTPEVSDFFPFYAENLKKKVVKFHHYTYSEQFLYPQTLSKLGLDLIHYTNFNSPVFFRGVKSIVSVYDLTLWFYPGRKQRSLFRKWMYRQVIQRSCLNAERVIAISESTKNDIVKYLGVDPGKIDVVYAAPPRRFTTEPDLKKADMIKAKYNITRPFFLYVGQWRAHKNLARLIRAFALFRRRYNLDYQLVIVGKADPLAPEVPATIKQLGLQDVVLTPGYIADNDLPHFYNEAEAFVFPSLYEGFGIPPLEAMAAGTPVISSNASVMPEVLGDAAQYFDPTNIEDMAYAMSKVASNFTLKQQLRERGFSQVKKYSFAKMARETLRVYERVLAG
ncbi:MAG: glycosyltransferase family 1 protein [bacterium]